MAKRRKNPTPPRNPAAVSTPKRQAAVPLTPTRKPVARRLPAVPAVPEWRRSAPMKGLAPSTRAAERAKPRVAPSTARQDPEKSASLPNAQRREMALKERVACKARPESNRGDGGSRRFVPWCERK